MPTKKIRNANQYLTRITGLWVKNPNASKASYKPKQRRYVGTKLIFLWGYFIEPLYDYPQYYVYVYRICRVVFIIICNAVSAVTFLSDIFGIDSGWVFCGWIFCIADSNNFIGISPQRTKTHRTIVSIILWAMKKYCVVIKHFTNQFLTYYLLNYVTIFMMPCRRKKCSHWDKFCLQEQHD